MSDDLKAQVDSWESEAAKATAKRPERRPSFRTTSDIEIKRLFTPLDLEGFDYGRELGFPGRFPYTRGVQPTMYRGRFWTMRQYAGFGTAEESNERYKYLISQGQTGISVAFDLPTQIGLDADHPLAEGEVGKVGVSIDSMKDMEVLFDGISLKDISTSMTINAPAAILLSMYCAVAEGQGVGPDKLSGTIQNDILKEYAARGTYIFPPSPSMRLITDTFAFCSKHMPKWNSISISGYHMREAGCTAVQEVAFTLANGIAYVQAAVDAGLHVDDFAPRLSFFFNAHNNVLEEVAKFRAARRLWARIMKDRFGAKNPRSMTLRFHTQTAGSTLTAQQPHVNIIRVALQSLAAVLGGTQSLHTNSYDEALALPTEESVRIALRTQQVIAHESGAADSVDPLGGSYYVESLTNEIERRAGEYIRKIDEIGGAVKAVEIGFVQKEINDSAYSYEKGIDQGDRVIVGVNSFQVEEDPPSNLLKVDPAVAKRQIERTNQVRLDRDENRVRKALDDIRRRAEAPAKPTDESVNMVPAFLEAVKAYATLGEICDVLREVFGSFQALDVA